MSFIEIEDDVWIGVRHIRKVCNTLGPNKKYKSCVITEDDSYYSKLTVSQIMEKISKAENSRLTGYTAGVLCMDEALLDLMVGEDGLND